MVVVPSRKSSHYRSGRSLRARLNPERTRSRNAATRVARVCGPPELVRLRRIHRPGRIRLERIRPALNRLMADAHQRRFDAVLVWKIDRFGRSLKHLVISLAELGALGVAFISFRDNLDLSTPSGRLMFQIIGAMAEFERALIQERVRA